MIPHVISFYKKKQISDITFCTLPTPKSISSLTNFEKKEYKKTKKLNTVPKRIKCFIIYFVSISLEIEITMYYKHLNKFELIIEVNYDINNTFTL